MLFLIIIFNLSYIEKIIVIFLIAIVLAAEAFNTAVEKLLDHIAPGPHHQVARIKDILAAAVFIICLAALLIGILIFAHLFSQSQIYA